MIETLRFVLTFIVQCGKWHDSLFRIDETFNLITIIDLCAGCFRCCRYRIPRIHRDVWVRIWCDWEIQMKTFFSVLTQFQAIITDCNDFIFSLVDHFNDLKFFYFDIFVISTNEMHLFPFECHVQYYIHSFKIIWRRFYYHSKPNSKPNSKPKIFKCKKFKQQNQFVDDNCLRKYGSPFCIE